MKGRKAGEPGSHYIRDLVAVPPEQFDEAIDVLGAGGTPVEEDELGRLLGPGSDPEVVAQILGFVRHIRVKDDPRTAADALRGRGIDASPVHAMGFLSHISYKPGTDPTPVGGGLPDVDPGSGDRIVAVVDSGISNERLPEWLTSSLRYDDPHDVETLSGGQASHGTFVSGLIRQLSPDHTVSLVKPRTVAVDELRRYPRERRHSTAPDPTTELHVAEAIVRLANRHAGARDQVEALNLSLGAYTADPDKDPLLVTLSQAIDFWRNAYKMSDCGVFAAGGNIPGSTPIWPGAYQSVRAVGAARDGDGQVVWDQNGNERPADPRPWITDVAPGCDVVGLAGQGKSLVRWSGSSFASAVAVASCVSGGRPKTKSVAWWLDEPVEYAHVRGLRHGQA